jgi:CubicO group peptidase (beta-lactamase class C family)
MLMLVVVPARAEVPDAVVRARADACFAAIAKGAAAFEAMATQAFTAELLARRSARDRAEMAARLHSDLGTMRLAAVRHLGDGRVQMIVEGSEGPTATIALDLEPSPPYRITRFGIDVEAGGKGAEDGPPPPIDADMPVDALGAALDRYLEPRVAKDAFAGVLLVAREGTPVYTRAFGVANRATGAATTSDTRHNIASIGKIFTKVAIAQLLANGRLTLASTIGELLPDHPDGEARGATVDQLLTHRGGIADFFGPGMEEAAPSLRSNADYYRLVSARPLTFAPGSQRKYCNGCYVVLGAIIERLSGMSYEDYIRRHVFDPAGMRRAGFFASDRLPDDTAIGYTRRGGGSGLTDSRALHGLAGSAAGGCYATAADLLAFDTALRTHRLLDARSAGWVLGAAPAEGQRQRGPLGIAGGAPGVNALLESDGTWAVIVLANLDPPAAGAVGLPIHRRLGGGDGGGRLRVERR